MIMFYVETDQKMNSTHHYPIFETFRNNTGLRGSLFPDRDYQTEKDLAKDDFIILVNSISSNLYSFIEVL